MIDIKYVSLYCNWILNTTPLSVVLKMFQKYVFCTAGHIFIISLKIQNSLEFSSF